MALINEGGKLLLRDGKLGTGQGCCCGGPCNPSTCPTGTECTPPCVCVDGECVEGGACNPSSCPNGTECTPPCVCVDGECVAQGSCCFWSCDYVADLVWPEIENPEDVPDVSDAMIAAGWVLVGIEWRKTIVGEANCDGPEAANAKAQELKAEVDGIIGGQGGFSNVNIDPMTSGLGCGEGYAEQECDDLQGTFRPGISCFDEPCEENPFP